MDEIKERAEELWKKLPIISEGWIPMIEDALREWKAIDEDAMSAIVEEQVLRAIEKQKAIDDIRINNLLTFLEELEVHYRDLNQYDDGKPIRRVISYIKAMEK